jgi:hypothetical protein
MHVLDAYDFIDSVSTGRARAQEWSRPGMQPLESSAVDLQTGLQPQQMVTFGPANNLQVSLQSPLPGLCQWQLSGQQVD